MSHSRTNECLIYGIQYKCRTCFDPGREVCSLTNKFSSTKTWRHLLNDVAQLKTNNEELLPKTICCKCMDKLVSCYNFQLQIQNVNMKFSQLLTNPPSSNTVQKNIVPPTQFDNFNVSLTESTSALPLHEYVTEIKLEDERIVPYDIAVETSDSGQEDRKNDFDNADACDSFKETYPEQCKHSAEDPQRYLYEENNYVLKCDLNESSSSSSEKSDYFPESGQKNDEHNKNIKRHSTNQSPKIACQHKGRAFDCTALNQEDIVNFHNIYYGKKSRAQQDAFILKYCSMSSIQRRRPKNCDRVSKVFQTKCYVRKNDSKLLVPVCQKTFLAVLCLKRRRLNYVTKIFHEQGVLPIEKRGGDHRSHKFEMKKAAVENFLSSFKCVESHYCRAQQRRLYFSNVSTVNELFAIYDENSPNELKVKLDYFRSIFNCKYNLGFKLPKIDACSICTELSEKIKKCRDENIKETYIEQKRLHSLKYKEFYALLKDENPQICIMSFACQKNQVLPKVNDQYAHYRRQLYLQNVTLVQGPTLSRNNVFIYTWTENQYLKNANLVASAVYHRLQCTQFKDNITTLRLIADGCGGQNKKFIMIAMLAKWFSQAAVELEKIELIFPIIGHSTLPADLVARKADKQIKQIKTILLPDEYEQVLAEFGTILKVIDSCAVNDWKEAGAEFLLPPECWHINISTTKKFYLQKHSNGKIVITGEENYRTHFNENNYRNVCKEHFDLMDMQPALIRPYTVKISSLKIRDVNNVMKMHFGEDWKNNENLKFYADFTNNLKQQQYDALDEDDTEQEEYCSEPIEEAPLLNI